MKRYLKSTHDRILTCDSFALVVIDPKEVDMLDLQHARRTIFVRQEKRTWTSSEVAP